MGVGVGVDKENLYMMTELERWEGWNQGVGVGADPALCPAQRNGLRENDMRQRQRGREKGMLAGLGRRGDEEEGEEAEDGLWRV